MGNLNDLLGILGHHVFGGGKIRQISVQFDEKVWFVFVFSFMGGSMEAILYFRNRKHPSSGNELK